MKAVVFDIRVNSLFSIRVPYTWQSALSYVLPPPSSIIGLVANAVQRYNNDKHPLEYLKQVENLVEWAGAKLLTPAVTKSYTTSAITKWLYAIGEKATNVLGRQYVYTKNIRIAIVVNDASFAEGLKDILKVTPLTCGDSESLVSVEDVLVFNAEKLEYKKDEEVVTEYPAILDFNKIELINGGGLIYPMHKRCLKAEPTKTKKGSKGESSYPLYNYILPVSSKECIFYPSSLTFKVKDTIYGYKIDHIGKVII
ncbi:MAG: type I-A CRISPR-associated protein Cas5a [candidate division WOR-3 bacterium]|nr:type I-A CRISPR-associated protein Cas5a [candidate division WOR-3 bacterium]MCX7757922.1 type I-A CRISPR-associated protein Cas5a [candidate division WOR-3 bacterium]MDW7987816.1 type I-A CRISPR-associated protein Cas5a [candidate division WOR-3 bacterium]